MEGRPPGDVEVKTEDSFQKCSPTHIISGNRSQQVRKKTVQDLVNVNLMRHAGIGRGKQHITNPFVNSSLKCVAKTIKDKSQLSSNYNSPVLKTVNIPVEVTENKVCQSPILSVDLEKTGSLPDISLCRSCSEKLTEITKLPCVVVRAEQIGDFISEKDIKNCKCGESHVTVVNFCGCYHSLPETLKSENVPVCAMENFIKCDGSETESVSSQDLKIVTTTEDKSVLFISCKENVALPVLHDEVCVKNTEEKPTRSKLEVGSSPSSLAQKSSAVSQFDVNGNRVPEPLKIEKKVIEKHSSASLSGNSSHFITSAAKQCELLQKADKSVSVQPCILKDNSSLCISSITVPAAENCATVKITGNPLKKRPVAFEVEKEVDLSTSVKRKSQYKSTRPDSLRCTESVFPPLESSVSIERLFKGIGTIQSSKKLNLESCNIPKSPLGVEAICDNYSESDIVASDTVSKMMFFPALPSSHCVQQGKQDSSRFKTANDMSSENSSSSNSDLENLNSVPTNRKTNMQHAASYPSQLSTSQASYADVIRTPAAAVSKIHPPQGVNSIFPENSIKVAESNVQPPLENNSAEKQQKKEEAHPMGSSEWIISRLSQLDVNTNAALNVNGVSPHSTPNGLDFVNPQPIAVSLEKPSFYHSGLQTNKNAPYSMSLSPVNLCSPNKVNNENRGLTDSTTEKLPTTKANEKMTVHSASSHSVIGLGELSQKLDGPANGRTDSLSSNPSSMSSSICDAFKYASSSSNGDNVDSKSKQPPVVIMDNFMPLENTSGISFGIDYDEVMKLCSDSGVLSNSVPFCEHPPIQDLDKTSVCNDSCSKTVESTEKLCICAAGSDNSYACDEPLCKKRAVVDCSKSTSRVTVAGKNLYWRDVEVNNQACDISSLVGFLSESWNAIEKSLKKGSSNSDAKIKYFEPEHL